MAKTEKQSLDQTIKSAFEFNKNAQKLHVTGDGQCFLEEHKSHAELHARRTSQTFRTVNREDFVKDEPVKDDAQSKDSQATDDAVSKKAAPRKGKAAQGEDNKATTDPAKTEDAATQDKGSESK